MLDLVFVFLNFRLLGRLRARLHHRFPDQIEEIWNSLGFVAQMSIVSSPTVFTFMSDRAALLLVFVARREEIPVLLMGDDEVADLVFKLNGKWSAGLYRTLSKASGLS
jgi:hypothetical protein